MSLHKLSVHTHAAQLDAIEQLFTDHGALSILLEDAGDYPLLEPAPGEMPIWPDTLMAGLFADDHRFGELQQALQEQFGIPPAHIRQELLPQQDWVRTCIEDFKPTAFGSRLWICPSWHTPPDPQAASIILDPGLAFGTGTHPTTAMCLRFLDAHLQQDHTVLDYGCGSGILAIAALRLGAARACAVDIDPQALIATWENAMRNGVEDWQLSIIPPAQIPADVQFDLVLANILSGPLVALAPTLAGLCRVGGEIVLAGLLVRQVAEMTEAYQPWFNLQQVEEVEGWALMHGVRYHDG